MPDNAKQKPKGPEGDSFVARLNRITQQTEQMKAAQAAPSAPPSDSDSFARRLRNLAGGSAPPQSAETPVEEAVDPLACMATPTGQGEYVCKAGDCIGSIAKKTGHFWKKIWFHAENTVLRETRQGPNVLMIGDRVFVPPIQPFEDAGQAEMRHRFRRLGEPGSLRIKLLANDKPVANQPYELKIGPKTHTGITDAEGKLAVPIRGDEKRAKLLVGNAPKKRLYDLFLGTLDPIDSILGVQQRLANLGFNPGPLDGIFGPLTEAGIRAFQFVYSLAQTGKPDDPTLAKLLECCGE